MTQISTLSGVGNPTTGKVQTKQVKKILNLGKKDISEMTTAEMDLYLAKNRLQVEQEIVDKSRGIGNLKSEKYQNAIDMLDDAIEQANGEDPVNGIGAIQEMLHDGDYNNHSRVQGIGSMQSRKEVRNNQAIGRRGKIKNFIKTVSNKATTTVNKVVPKQLQNKTNQFLNNVKDKLKNPVKAVKDIATAPARLAAKAILEVTLPQAAPYFLYLFINDPALIAKLPEKIRRKRKQQERIANFIVNGLGMKRTHFMSIVRTGIMKKMGKSPETILAAKFGGKVSGIGVIPPEVIMVVIQVISQIVKFFKKKKEEAGDPKEGVPEDGDFVSTDPELAEQVKQQNDEAKEDEARESGGDGGENSTGGRKTGWSS